MTERQQRSFTGICRSRRCQRVIFRLLHCDHVCRAQDKTDRQTAKKQAKRAESRDGGQ